MTTSFGEAGPAATVEAVGPDELSGTSEAARRPRALGGVLLHGCAVLLIGVGTTLRLVHYLDRRSLWLDEAMLALNIASRSYADLTRPLDYNQTAPLLFLWTERLAVAIGGVNELSLRAVPMAAGILLLVLLWPLTRRLLGEAGAVAAVTLAALSPALIRYANEAKPYGTDALVSVAMILAVVRVRDAPASRWRWTALLAVGLAAVLVSVPGVFVASVSWTALLLERSVRRERLGWLVSCAATWTAAGGALYAFVYRSAANNPFQQQGYERAFLFPGPEWLSKAGLALQGTVLPTFAGLGSAIPAVSAWWWIVVVFAAGLGLVFIHRRQGFFAVMLVAGPFAAALAASALRRYPVGVPRMMVFASPLLVLLAAAAAAQIAAWLEGRVRRGFVVAASVLLAGPMAMSRLEDARLPYRGEDAAALVAAFRERPRLKEPIYVAARGIPSWVFYTTNWNEPNRERLAFYAGAAGSGPCFENAPGRGRPVRDEGFDQVWDQRGRKEILGVATGRQWRWPSYMTAYPDEGWAANEAERVAHEANPCVWLYFTRLSERAHKPVMWELRDNYGAQNRFELYVPGGVLWRYCASMDRWAKGLAEREASKRLGR
jgi:Dolichyl-phosphate-mannose-protein mannosyltransferase